MRHVYSYQLQNIEDSTVIVYYTNHGSRWINRLTDAEEWLREEEVKCLDSDKIKRPSTKWKFVSFFNVDVKVVLDFLCWAQALYQTGCITLRVGEEGQWWCWMSFKTTFVCGVVSQCTEEHYHIEAQKKHAV